MDEHRDRSAVISEGGDAAMPSEPTSSRAPRSIASDGHKRHGGISEAEGERQTAERHSLEAGQRAAVAEGERH